MRRLFASLATIAFVLEIMIRLVFPPTDLLQMKQNDYGFDIYTEDYRKKEFAFSFGKKNEIKSTGYINNYGWPSYKDYNPKENKTVIAVIGDSYVAANYVDYEDSFGYHLQRNLGDNFDVLTFGRNGASFSDYADVVQYVEDHFEPDAYVVLITDGSVSSGFIRNGLRDYRHRTSISDQDSAYHIFPKTRRVSKTSTILKRSAILRYVKANYDLSVNFGSKTVKDPRNRKLDLATQLLVLRHELDRIRSSTEKSILFAFDSKRKELYNGCESNLSIQEYFSFKELLNESSLLDLSEYFKLDYSLNNKNFEFPNNDHWNERGNQVFSRALADRLR